MCVVLATPSECAAVILVFTTSEAATSVALLRAGGLPFVKALTCAACDARSAFIFATCFASFAAVFVCEYCYQEKIE